MPFHVPFILDFSSERLLCIINVITKQDKYRLKSYAAEIDFQKGLIEEFDVPLSTIINGPALDNLKLPNVVIVEKEPLEQYNGTLLYISGDAEFSRLIVVFKNKIYLVPTIKTEKLAGSGWRPADKENEK